MLRDSLIEGMSARMYLTLKRLNFKYTNNAQYRAYQEKRRVVTNTSYSYKPFDDKKCIFVHVPKCAGVSVCNTLFGNLAGGHATLEEYFYIFEPSKILSYFKFAIVRNPWDRVVSAFHFLKAGGFSEADRRWAEENISCYDDFGSFVRGWVNTENIWKRHHFTPQHHYILDRKHKVKLDFIGRFERLDDDFKVIARTIGCDRTMMQKVNGSGRSDYRNYYDESTIKIIEDVYAEDIELLGYRYND